MSRTIPTAVAFIASALIAAGCASNPSGGSAATATATATSRGGASSLPTPYTAEQIRQSNPPGTRLIFRIERPGQPATVRTIHFISGDDGRAVMETHVLSEAGAPLAPVQRSEPTWIELRDHAAFPPGTAHRRRATCTVEAGTFDCWLYTVEGEDGAVSRFHFADVRPGPPVLYEIEKGGAITMRMELTGDSRKGGRD